MVIVFVDWAYLNLSMWIGIIICAFFLKLLIMERPMAICQLGHVTSVLFLGREQEVIVSYIFSPFSLAQDFWKLYFKNIFNVPLTFEYFHFHRLCR